eukprot:gnl/Chilomastix_cuspidata/6253.p1 GENE.gnl/Chilomastix_cuspidata/6253~~gnl/Chilomastix_cuspidata/6253.p1  ORF type:complete len:146 (-),score=16.72 gnl/Chilomastix_cuspidata/6253:22-459(-)
MDLTTISLGQRRMRPLSQEKLVQLTMFPTISPTSVNVSQGCSFNEDYSPHTRHEPSTNSSRRHSVIFPNIQPNPVQHAQPSQRRSATRVALSSMHPAWRVVVGLSFLFLLLTVYNIAVAGLFIRTARGGAAFSAGAVSVRTLQIG